MTLREFLEYAIQPVCVIDDVEQGNMYIQIDHYNAGSEFWLAFGRTQRTYQID